MFIWLWLNISIGYRRVFNNIYAQPSEHTLQHTNIYPTICEHRRSIPASIIFPLQLFPYFSSWRLRKHSFSLILHWIYLCNTCLYIHFIINIMYIIVYSHKHIYNLRNMWFYRRWQYTPYERKRFWVGQECPQNLNYST